MTTRVRIRRPRYVTVGATPVALGQPGELVRGVIIVNDDGGNPNGNVANCVVGDANIQPTDPGIRPGGNMTVDWHDTLMDLGEIYAVSTGATITIQVWPIG